MTNQTTPSPTQKLIIVTIINPDGQLWENCTTVGECDSNKTSYHLQHEARTKAWVSLIGTIFKVKPPYGFWDKMAEAGFTCNVFVSEMKQVQVLKP